MPGRCAEAYVYDATNGSVTCVSCSPTGAPPLGSAHLMGVEQDNPLLPGFSEGEISPDGSRVFFETADALVPQDTNGLPDVYEWENGRIYLISSGQGTFGSSFSGASSNGRRRVHHDDRSSGAAGHRERDADLRRSCRRRLSVSGRSRRVATAVSARVRRRPAPASALRRARRSSGLGNAGRRNRPQRPWPSRSPQREGHEGTEGSCSTKKNKRDARIRKASPTDVRT